jgi:hypothetical protein
VLARQHHLRPPAARHRLTSPPRRRPRPITGLISRALTRPTTTPVAKNGLTLGVCRVHFMRNILARVPKASSEMVAAAIRTIFAQPDPGHVRSQLDEVARMHGTTPSPRARSPRASGTAHPTPHPRSRWPTR